MPMPVFRYQGMDPKGKKTTGVVDAENERAARSKLRKSNIFPTLVVIEGRRNALVAMGKSEAKFGSLFGSRVKTQDIALMTRQFASLLAAGIPLVEALGALSEQMDHPTLRSAVASIRERVTEGDKLSSAMRAFPKIFNDLYVNMVTAGESGGMLEQVLERLADVTEAQARLRSKVVGALTYPAIIGVVAAGMTIALVTLVVPQITAMLIDMGGELPLPTKIVVGISNFFLGWWWLQILVIIAGIYFFRRWVTTEKGRTQFDAFLLRAPLIGRLMLLTNVARLTRTLGTLLQSGVPMLVSLEIVSNVVTNVLVRQAIIDARNAVKEGASLAEPLRRSELFPSLAIHMIATGEKTGELEKMLERVASNFETQVDNAVGTLTGLMEPVMIVFMALVIGGIAISVLLPMFQMTGQMGGM